MKNGLVFENEELIYYRDDVPYHAGVIQIDDAIYYISSRGRAVKGQHVVHSDMTNDILKRGTYTFGDDYKLVAGSFIAPKKAKRKKKKTKAPKRVARITFFQRVKRALKSKKNQAAILIMLGFAAFMLFVPKVSHLEAQPIESQKTEEAEAATFSSQEVKMILPTFEEDILLCSKAAKQVYDGQMELKTAVETGDPYRPFLFNYHLDNATGTLRLAETEDLSNAHEYTLTEEEASLRIDNLKVDTTYYYEVIVDGQSYPGTFHTAASPRFVSIPGLMNTRDIGGYVNQDGQKVKQGLLIRGVELDGLVYAPYFIPEEELENVQDTFDFRFDLDLRGAYTYNGPYTSRLGIEHKFYDAPMYGSIFSTNYYTSIRSIFADLADPEKYPMYLHCTWGKDRTGTIVFLLQGLLNLAEEDMKQEYLLTSYTDSSLSESTNMDVVINGLKHYAGDTLQEKIVTYLTTDIGVTEAEIESIRSIFLED